MDIPFVWIGNGNANKRLIAFCVMNCVYHKKVHMKLVLLTSDMHLFVCQMVSMLMCDWEYKKRFLPYVIYGIID